MCCAGNGAFYHQCPRLGTSGLPSPTRGKGPEAAFLLRAASGFIAVLFVMRMSFLGYACDQWLALLDAMQPGDELYNFRTSAESWKGLYGKPSATTGRRRSRNTCGDDRRLA